MEKGLIPDNRYHFYYPISKGKENMIAAKNSALDCWHDIEAIDIEGGIRYFKVTEDDLNRVTFITPIWNRVKPIIIEIPYAAFPRKVDDSLESPTLRILTLRILTY